MVDNNKGNRMKRFSGFVTIAAVLLAFVLPGCEDDTVDPGDTYPPHVIEVTPTDGSVNMPLDVVITAKFSETMIDSTINETTCVLMKGYVDVLCTVTYDPATKTVTIDPTTSLEYERTYTATITDGCKDLAGNGLDPQMAWSFTTVPYTLGTVTGHVKDSMLDTGIPGVTISLSPFSAQTGPNGYYILSDVNPGPQNISASQAIYTTSIKSIDVPQGGSTTMDFTLSTIDLGEPNEDFAHAYSFYQSTQYAAYIRLPSDVDYYSFSAEDGDSLRIRLGYVPDLSTPDIAMHLYDPSHSMIMEHHVEDPGPYTYGIRVDDTGTYYLRFEGYGASNTVPYTFTVTFH